jgi:alpha/beta superfamily hydrolase
VDGVLYEGYAQMMAEPQYTEIPTQAIESIVGWLAPQTAAATTTGSGAASEPEPAQQRFEFEGASLVERPLCFGRLFGVLCQPVGARADGPVVVMLNAGSVHHMGPNRLYVELARALGATGVTSFRMDLRGLGESAVAGEPRENHPYPEGAVADTEAALRLLRERLPGTRRFVLLGLCSGAHTAFHAAVAACGEVELADTLLINPLTFHWVEGMSLDSPTTRHYQEVAYYRQNLRDPAKWLKLLRGKVRLRAAARVVAEQARRLARGWFSRSKPSRLASDLETLFARGRTLTLFVARQDPGYDLLSAGVGRRLRRDLREGRLRVSFIENADHTFSRRGPRRELIRGICERVRELG